jgi:hypothetical protein
MRQLLAVLAFVTVGACSDTTSPRSDLLRINVLPDALELVNTSQQPVYVFAAERNSLALLDWAPCQDPTTCEGIAVGGSLVLPFDEITGYGPGAEEAVVYHWHLIPDGAAFKPDSIRSTVVELHVHH